MKTILTSILAIICGLALAQTPQALKTVPKLPNTAEAVRKGGLDTKAESSQLTGSARTVVFRSTGTRVYVPTFVSEIFPDAENDTARRSFATYLEREFKEFEEIARENRASNNVALALAYSLVSLNRVRTGQNLPSENLPNLFKQCESLLDKELSSFSDRQKQALYEFYLCRVFLVELLADGDSAEKKDLAKDFAETYWVEILGEGVRLTRDGLVKD
jgi:hypothetical protein